MEYFTSKAQEKVLDAIYQEKIIDKQKEIDENAKRTNSIPKYKAKAHVKEEERVFIVVNVKVYLGEIKEENLCPNTQEEGGKRYILDSNFDYCTIPFINKYKSYKVTFNPSGKYGPTVYYFTKIGACPALLEAPDGTKILVEDESNYEILCC
jgi:hypothetical protein